MADIWRGDILLLDDTLLRDVVLESQNIASSPSIPAGTLRFLSAVATARIPLYLAAGPSLDVWTTSEETQSWFEAILLSQASAHASASDNTPTRQWWTQARSQSPIGVLVQVEARVEHSKSPRITEILFYGTIATSTKGALPTPPSSSPQHEAPAALPELRVYALPLSSDLLYQPATQSGSEGLKAPGPAGKQEPQFLPAPSGPVCNGSPKRKRDIFEEATELRRKARRKAAEDIAAAAAKAAELARPAAHRRSLSIDTKATTPFPDFRPGSAGCALARPQSRPISRSPSISSDARPLSRKGLPDNHASKRSTLSQVATVPLYPEKPTTYTRNKEALSRVVLAAMRMQGLQQRKKSKSRRGSLAPGVDSAEQMSEEAAAEEAAKDEEYKLIYHQTYKGAALALRKHMSSQPLHLQPERLREVVEKLLAIFCNDPLAEAPASTKDGHEDADVLSTPAQKGLRVPGSGQQGGGTPFDLPSGNRAIGPCSKKAEVAHTGSPVNRRKIKAEPTEVG